MQTVAEIVKTELFTDSQVRCKITAAVKKWLKERNYEKTIQFHYTRGTYHFTNCSLYMLTAKMILELATGLQFEGYNYSMARIIKGQF